MKLQLGPTSDREMNLPIPTVQNTKAGSWCDSLTLLLPAKYLLRLFPSSENISALSEGFHYKYFLKALYVRTLVPSYCLYNSRFSFTLDRQKGSYF